MPKPQTNPTHSRRWLILGVLGLAQLMVVLDATIVNIALPSAQKALHFSDANRQWIITAYALAFGSLLLLGGRLGDLFGRKRTLITGLVGFASASAVGGLAQSFEVLVAARALQGAFGAILAPSALSLLSTTFTEPSERGKAFAIYGAIAAGGGAVGLLLGGLLTEYLSWRWCLYVNLFLAVPAGLAAVALLRNQVERIRTKIDIPGTLTASSGLFALVYGFSNAQTHSWGAPLTIAMLAVPAGLAAAALLHNQVERIRTKIDIPGTLTASSGLFALVYGFSNAQTHSWGAPLTIAMLAASVVLLAAFVAVEHRVEHPLLPMRVVLDRNRGGSYVAVGIVGAGMFGVFLFLTYYLQQTLGFSPVKTGLAFLPMIGVLSVTASVANTKLLPRIGARVPIVAGLLLAAVGMAMFTGAGIHSTYAASVLPGLLVVGVGLGLVMAPAMNSATLGVTSADAGVASAMVNTMQQVGGSVGTALLSTLAASATSGFMAGKVPAPAMAAQAAVHGYTTAFWWSAAIFAVGAIVCGLLLRPGVQAAADPAAEPVLAH